MCFYFLLCLNFKHTRHKVKKKFTDFFLLFARLCLIFYSRTRHCRELKQKKIKKRKEFHIAVATTIAKQRSFLSKDK